MADEQDTAPVAEAPRGAIDEEGSFHPDSTHHTKPSPTGIATSDEQREATIAALLRERAGYIGRGLGDRVKQVESQLERLGIERVETATADGGAERATVKKPAKR